MNAVPAISVIVAAYNAGKFMRSIVDDILDQTFSDFEVLMIDDGSTDNTGPICDDYARRDPRIRVFHEPHHGVTHARQVAIEHAKGNYMIRIDTDDRLEQVAFERMYQTIVATNADLLICDYREVTASGTIYKEQKPSALTPNAIANDLLEGQLFGALWNKMFKMSCIKNKEICFHQNLDLREDIVFVLDVLPHIRHIAYHPKAYYLYDKRANINSLSNTYLAEDKHYYDQEVLWYSAALDCSLISVSNRRRLVNNLLNYAYITLTGKFYTSAEWNELFAPHAKLFEEAKKSYKQKIVHQALNGHFRTASLLRRIIASLRGKA